MPLFSLQQPWNRACSLDWLWKVIASTFIALGGKLLLSKGKSGEKKGLTSFSQGTWGVHSKMRPWQSISIPTFPHACFCFGGLVSLGWDCLPRVCLGPRERSPESLIALTTNKFFLMDLGPAGFLKLWMEQRDFDPTDPHKQVFYLFCHSPSTTCKRGTEVGIVILRHAGLSHADRSSLYRPFIPLQRVALGLMSY